MSLFYLFRFIMVHSVLIRFIKKIILLIRNNEVSYPKFGYHFRRPILYNYLACINILIYVAFEIIINTNSHTRYIKLPELKEVLMFQDYLKKKYGSCLKYSKHGAFTLIYNRY
jgi:hypothetical protein